jgi:hypothetical protein
VRYRARPDRAFAMARLERVGLARFLELVTGTQAADAKSTV